MRSLLSREAVEAMEERSSRLRDMEVFLRVRRLGMTLISGELRLQAMEA